VRSNGYGATLKRTAKAQEWEMKAKPIVLVLSLVLASFCAQAGGFVSETVVKPINSDELKRLNNPDKDKQLREMLESISKSIKEIGQDQNDPDKIKKMQEMMLMMQAIQNSGTSAIARGSSTCVTPRGSCDAGGSAINGTACYCTFSPDKVFGRIQ
jgi:hypothetical protein